MSLSLNVRDITDEQNYSFKSKRIVDIMFPAYHYDVNNTKITRNPVRNDIVRANYLNLNTKIVKK